MIELTCYHEILSKPLAFWVASSRQNKPDTIRCTGLGDMTTMDKITFFIPQKHSEVFLLNVMENPKITLMACSVLTFESYQYKGIYQSIRGATEEEIKRQNNYVTAFTDILESVGFERGLGETFRMQPSLAVTFDVTEVYEQTPHKGTGNLMK